MTLTPAIRKYGSMWAIHYRRACGQEPSKYDSGFCRRPGRQVWPSQLNERKCKEMRISFAKREAEFALIVINEKAVEVVPCVNLLGLIISKDLKWNCHVSEISRKVSARLYLLKQLKRACVATEELITFYTTCIRPVIEYASPVFHIIHSQATCQTSWKAYRGEL